MVGILVTPRTRRETLRKAALEGTPLPLRLAKTLSGSDLMRILTEHVHEAYGDELAELLLSSPGADERLVEAALKYYPKSPGVKNAAALCSGASEQQLRRLARSSHNSVRRHARLSLLSSSLDGGSERTFKQAVKRARRAQDPSAELYIIVVHPDVPQVVLEEVAADDTDFLRDEARRRLARRRPDRR